MNNLMKINDDERNKSLSKKIVLDCLTAIRIDHNIDISTENFRVKIELVYNDCKNLTNEEFITNCEVIRKRELYGKIPASFVFVSPNQSIKTEEVKPWKYL